MAQSSFQSKPEPIHAALAMLSEIASAATGAHLAQEAEKKNRELYAVKRLIELLTRFKVPEVFISFAMSEVDQLVRLCVVFDHDGILKEIAGDLPNILSNITTS